MKKSSMPHPYHSSKVADPNVNGDHLKDNRGVRSNVTEKKSAAGAATNKLEKKPSVDINESAEAFIQKFRHQLLLQRLESIENYEKMLARGL